MSMCHIKDRQEKYLKEIIIKLFNMGVKVRRFSWSVNQWSDV